MCPTHAPSRRKCALTPRRLAPTRRAAEDDWRRLGVLQRTIGADSAGVGRSLDSPRGDPTHPALRRPGPPAEGRRGGRLRQGAASPRRGPHRHDARRARRRAGRSADRGGPARLHLERGGRGRPPGQPGPRPLRRHPGRLRGVSVHPGPLDRLSAGDVGRRQGLRHVRRAGRHRGVRAAGPRPPARDRPPRRGAVPRPARRREPQARHEGDPRVGVVRAGAADGEGVTRTTTFGLGL